MVFPSSPSVDCNELTVERVFYKSNKKQLIVLGKVINGPLAINNQLTINGRTFPIVRMEANKTEIESADIGANIGVQLSAKPKTLRSLGVTVYF